MQYPLTQKSKQLIKSGGISDFRKVDIAGTEQYILIEGKDRSKPITLFLHGGPGVPMPFDANSRALYPSIINSTVAVYWDRRGAGRSYQS